MSFNQNNETIESETESLRGRRTVVQRAQPQTLYARCCKRKFKWNSGRPNDYNELIEYQLLFTVEYSLKIKLWFNYRNDNL